MASSRSIARLDGAREVEVLTWGARAPRQAPGTGEGTISGEAEVAARLAAGDEQALAELYDRVSSSAYGLALAMLRDPADAEEAVADAFAQVWRSASSYDPSRGSLAAWVMTITRSRALDRLRMRRRRGTALERAAQGSEEGLALPMTAPDPADARAERGETGELVRKSLEALPEAQRRVIEMAYFEGLSQSEIAAGLREPLGTVKTRMRAGMEKLRQALSPLRAEVGR